VATAAYWGDESTDAWWFGEIERLSWRQHASGEASLIHLARSPSLVMTYAAGAAAAAAERWPLVFTLMTRTSTEDHAGSSRQRLISVITPGKGIAGGSRRLHRFVSGILQQSLGLGAGAAVDAWERFEYLCALTAIRERNLPWVPRLRVEGAGSSEGRTVVEVWLDEHLDVIQPFLGSPGWLDGVDVTNRRSDFASAYAHFVHTEDSRLLAGGVGFLPSQRRYPGQWDDSPEPPGQPT
jgi:hypothetical protein